MYCKKHGEPKPCFLLFLFRKDKTFAFYLIHPKAVRAGNTREVVFLRAAENRGSVNEKNQNPKTCLGGHFCGLRNNVYSLHFFLAAVVSLYLFHVK